MLFAVESKIWPNQEYLSQEVLVLHGSPREGQSQKTRFLKSTTKFPIRAEHHQHWTSLVSTSGHPELHQNSNCSHPWRESRNSQTHTDTHTPPAVWTLIFSPGLVCVCVNCCLTLLLLADRRGTTAVSCCSGPSSSRLEVFRGVPPSLVGTSGC